MSTAKGTPLTPALPHRLGKGDRFSHIGREKLDEKPLPLTKARLAKEFHPLLLPGCVGAVAALAQLFKLSEIYEFLATFTFCTCVCLIAAIPFGTEFQQRTFSLLLSQPLERFRLWKEKLFALMLAAVPLLLLQILAGQPSRSDSLGVGGFLFLIVCSAAFWTLAARSTIGGVVFSVIIQFLVILVLAGAGMLAEKIFGFDLDTVLKGLPTSSRAVLISLAVLAGAAYIVLFLWLGWRKFAALELREDSPGEASLGLDSAKRHRWWLSWLRCRSAGGLANLVRKEIRLQKPVFLGAAILGLCWIVAAVLFRLTLLRTDIFHGILALLAGGFATMIPMLTGLIAQVEEKTLGTAQWHLTMPISTRTQWLIKLVTAAAVALCLGYILPLALGWVTVPQIVGGLGEKGDELLIIPASGCILFVSSFWAGTLLDNTVRCFLAALATLVIIAVCCTFGRYGGLLGLQTFLLQALVAHFQLPLDYFAKDVSILLIWFLVFAVVTLVALIQSLIQFRRAPTGVKVFGKYLFALATAAFLISAWGVDFLTSAGKLSGFAWLQWELENGVRALHLKSAELTSGGTWRINSQELERTGNLSPRTRRWLKNSSIVVTPMQSRLPSPTQFWVDVTFPSGKTYAFAFNGPPPATNGLPSNHNQTKPNQ